MLEAKHQVKRRIAKTSFVTMLLMIPSLFYIVLTGDENTAANLAASSGILIIILGCLTSIVMMYMGLSHHSDMQKQDEEG